MKHIVKSDNKISELKGGLKKDDLDNKIRFDLIPPELLERVAMQFTSGSKKYGVDNWRKANTEEQEHLFIEAAYRHFVKVLKKQKDGEDHLAACITNLIMYEWHTSHKK